MTVSPLKQNVFVFGFRYQHLRYYKGDISNNDNKTNLKTILIIRINQKKINTLYPEKYSVRFIQNIWENAE